MMEKLKKNEFIFIFWTRDEPFRDKILFLTKEIKTLELNWTIADKVIWGSDNVSPDEKWRIRLI